jgi:hypothetical protein
MENGLTRIVAALCAAGAIGLLWMFGVFVATPWQQGRMLALSGAELQLIIVPLAVGVAAAWGALHILAIADRHERPGLYQTLRALLIVAAIAAVLGGRSWTLMRII